MEAERAGAHGKHARALADARVARLAGQDAAADQHGQQAGEPGAGDQEAEAQHRRRVADGLADDEPEVADVDGQRGHEAQVAEQARLGVAVPAPSAGEGAAEALWSPRS